ncbi:MAG: tetratricopeptide repeat protein [Myxococcota bacterium]
MNYRSVLEKAALIVLVLSLVAGCAVREHLKRGNRHLKLGEYSKAIEAFEEALRVSPGHKTAHARIRTARREHVRATLAKADAALSSGELATALRYAKRARRLPLDLEDVDLVQRIDTTIERAATQAEETVAAYEKRGHFLSAVELSHQIVSAVPGVSSRETWGEEVRKKAQEHYVSAADRLQGEKLFGSAAIQMAFARKVGSPIEVADVVAAWNRFAELTCFAEPDIRVIDKTGKAKDLIAKIETTARIELAGLRERCGEGTRKLGVRIQLNKVVIVDDTKIERAAKALPGVEIKTEEVYFEEEPYTAIEEYTEYEVRIERLEKRDCAPRPGKRRGCRTWVEDIEVEIPIKKTREVQKVRRIRKTRPIKGPLPEDKVLSYAVTTVERSVLYEGTVTLTGDATATHTFSVEEASKDSGNERASAKGLVIEADPLEIKSMSTLTAEAAEALAREIERDVAESVEAWAKRLEEQARKRVLEGQLPQAEELYLKLLALGADRSNELKKFFGNRYGRDVVAVMDILAGALGREVESDRRRGRRGQRRKGAFPKRGVASRQPPNEPKAPAPQATTGAGATEKPPAEEAKPMTRLDDAELRELEAASMEAAEAPKQGTEAAPEEGEGAEAKKKEGVTPESGGDAPKKAPRPGRKKSKR